MAIDLTCPECGEPMRFSDRAAGKRIRCPNCDSEIRIPKVASPLPDSKPAAKKAPAIRKPPARAAAPTEEPGPVVSPAVVPGTTGDAGRAGAVGSRLAARRRPAGPPWPLVAVAAVLGLALVAVAVSRMGSSGESARGKKVAQGSGGRQAPMDPDEGIIILDDAESPPAGKRGKNKGRTGQPKKEQSDTEADGPEKPVVPAGKTTPPKPAPETPDPQEPNQGEVTPKPSEQAEPDDPAPAEGPGEEAKPSPADPAPPEPVPPEPAPLQPVPEEAPPEKMLPPEVPPPEPAPPKAEDQTKVEVIEILPSPKPPEAKPEPNPSGRKGDKPPRRRPKARPKRPKPGEEAPPVVIVGPPDPNCPKCRGLGKVPLAPFKPYGHMEGMPPPKPEQAVFWRFCPKCQQGHDEQSLVDAEAARLKTAGQKHLRWEQKTTWQLVRAENHLVTIHAQLPPAEAQKAGMAVEMMAKHLQELTGSMELTVTRPDDYEMIVLWEKQNYAQFLRLMEPEWMPKAGNNWSIVKQVAGSTIGDTSFFRQMQAGSPPPAHMAVNMAGKQQILRASSRRAPVWLREGFASYCENAVLGKNLVHAIDYEVSKLQLNPDWSIEMRRLAAFNKLKPWKSMFALELRDYQAPEYVTSFSMVAFLIRSQPVKFLNLVQAIGQGMQSEAALTEAYGKGVEKLQGDWLKWLAGRR